MYSQVQLKDCSRAPWQLQMVQKTYIDVVLTWYDMPFLIDNCQLAHKLSTPNRWEILQISSKTQLTGYSRVPWWLQMVEMTYLDIVLFWDDIPSSVDNCQFVQKMSTLNERKIPLMSLRMLLTDHCSLFFLEMVSVILTSSCLNTISHS